MVVVILMGVCGCGKTTVGEALAEHLHWPFRDADEFHSVANKRKMSTSTPLTDEDRLPWLLSIHDHIKSFQANQSAVLTCSALKRRYRDILRSGAGTTASSQSDSQTNCQSSSSLSSSSSTSQVLFVLLKGSRKLLETRLARRMGHFMPPDLLTSQLATLEEPEADEACLSVDIDAEVTEIVGKIVDWLRNEV